MSVLSEGIAFSLKNTVTGFYLSIKDNAAYAGAEAVGVASDASLPRWFLRREQNAYYLINASAPTMCLNVAYERVIAGGSLQQWSCNGGRSELWNLVPTSSGSFSLVNVNSGLAVGAGLSSRSSITQMETASHALAQWEVVGLEPSSIPPKVPVSTKPGSFTPFNAPTLADEMIYNVYAPIYSQAGNLATISQDLPRIAGLGFSTILIMPIHPIGIPTGNHPAVESPYAVADYYAVAPALGQLSDFTSLVTRAQILGLRVIMDVVLNHTAWNHPFIMQHPEWYVHADRNKNNVKTISQAFWFKDVAQLDFKSGNFVLEYMTTMLVWWVQNCKVNGFRFDTADNPYGDDRMVPASAWSFIGQSLKAVDPRIILLGECTNPDLSLKPFNMDYNNYSLQPAIVSATRLQNASDLARVFHQLKTSHPPGMLHTSIMQTWDMDLDLRMYGGCDATLAAAVFNFTIEGVPMLFAGEEVGNDRGGVNTHIPINWNGPMASRFNSFYTGLGQLRRRSVALRRGSTTWLKVSGAGVGLIAFIRTWESEQYLIAVNFSSLATLGNMIGESTSGWTEVTPPGAAYPAAHTGPPSVKLGPWDFIVFARDSSGDK